MSRKSFERDSSCYMRTHGRTWRSQQAHLSTFVYQRTEMKGGKQQARQLGRKAARTEMMNGKQVEEIKQQERRDEINKYQESIKKETR